MVDVILLPRKMKSEEEDEVSRVSFGIWIVKSETKMRVRCTVV